MKCIALHPDLAFCIPHSAFRIPRARPMGSIKSRRTSTKREEKEEGGERERRNNERRNNERRNNERRNNERRKGREKRKYQKKWQNDPHPGFPRSHEP